MKIKKYCWFCLIFLFLINLTFALDSVTDILDEGGVGSYNIGSNNYEIYVAAITDSAPTYIKLKVNGILSPTLSEGQSYTVNEQNNIRLKINQLMSNSCGDVMCDSVDFTIYSLSNCGNNICDSDEDCLTCSQDCSCNSGFQCQNGQCTEIIACGDYKCNSGETCEEDSCCNGISINLNSDTNNCGSCGNVCYSNNQTCASGVCVLLDKYCGDKACTDNENCGNCIKDCSCSAIERCENDECVAYCGNGICDNNENCCQDCGCDVGFECLDNSCVSLGDCSNNKDCNDNNNCTQDVCSGTPNECSYIEIVGCGDLNSFENNITLNTKNSSSAQNDIIENKSINEIRSTSEPQKINLIQKIINWIWELFM